MWWLILFERLVEEVADRYGRQVPPRTEEKDTNKGEKCKGQK